MISNNKLMLFVVTKHMNELFPIISIWSARESAEHLFFDH